VVSCADITALAARQGLFTSDQDLYTDSRMGQLNVLTGTQGEIR
uniref:Peroxidase (Fragments) n=1 Tax=Cynara cardunculus var. scolymus TaxID=59895 RepID=PER_CYNCS|nr:RecName: Full=Peroxidase [Cynara cardunculus var. scolymus]